MPTDWHRWWFDVLEADVLTLHEVIERLRLELLYQQTGTYSPYRGRVVRWL